MSRVPAIVALRAFVSSVRDMNTSAERNERARLRRRKNLRSARLAANRRRNALAYVAHPLFVAGVMAPPPPPQQAPVLLPPSRLRAPLALLTLLHHRNHNLRGLDLGFLSLSLSTLLPPQPLADGDGSDNGYEPLPMMGQDDVAMGGMPEAKGEEEKGEALAGEVKVKEGSVAVGGGGMGGGFSGGMGGGMSGGMGGAGLSAAQDDEKEKKGKGRGCQEFRAAAGSRFAKSDDEWKYSTPAVRRRLTLAARIDEYGEKRKACRCCRRDGEMCVVWAAGSHKCSWCVWLGKPCTE